MAPDYRHHYTTAKRWPRPTYYPAKRTQPERLPWRWRCRATASDRRRSGKTWSHRRTGHMRLSATRVTGWCGGEGTASNAREETEQRATRSRAPRARREAGKTRGRERSRPAQPSPTATSGRGVGQKKVSGHHCWLTVQNFIKCLIMYQRENTAKIIYIFGIPTIF